jgi:hypothetical protein
MSYSPYVLSGRSPNIKVGVWYDDKDTKDGFIVLCDNLPNDLIAHAFINWLNGGKGTPYMQWLRGDE